MKASNSQQNNLNRLVLMAMVSIALVFSSVTYAVEISPADQVNPTEITPDFDGLGDSNQLLQEQAAKNPLADNCRQTWLGWLTGVSRKPANFHFIDFLELLN